MKFLLIALSLILLLLFPLKVLAATDADYEKTGEQIMQQMMGSSHEQADQNIKDTMGADFLKQMHIAMGKLAEKNANGSAQLGTLPMMGLYAGGGGYNMMAGYAGMGNFGIWAVLAWLTWILIVIALVLGIVWLWKQIQKK